jgi:hypothetical protein
VSDEIQASPDLPTGDAGATGGAPADSPPAASEPPSPVAAEPTPVDPAAPPVVPPSPPAEAPPVPVTPPADAPPGPPVPVTPPPPPAPGPVPTAPDPAAPVPVPPPAQPVVPPAVPAQPPVTMPTEPVTPSSAAPESIPDDWPQAGYTGPQPWMVSSPPPLSHDRGFVASGAAGELVVELAAALAHLGYETATSRGENPQGVYGESERQAVLRFRAEYGIQEDPAVIAVTTADTVGPWTWEALFRLIRRAQADQAERA